MDASCNHLRGCGTSVYDEFMMLELDCGRNYWVAVAWTCRCVLHTGPNGRRAGHRGAIQAHSPTLPCVA
jgi:hypothetical protein